MPEEAQLLNEKLAAEASLASLRVLGQNMAECAGRRKDILNQYALAFAHDCVARSVFLGSETMDLLQAGKWIVASMTARGFIETVALLLLFASKYKHGEERAVRSKVIGKFVFATRLFGGELKGIHVNDALRALGEHSPDAQRVYNVLCEMVHPNWLGVRWLAGITESGPDQSNQIAYVTVFRGISEVTGCEPRLREFMLALSRAR